MSPNGNWIASLCPERAACALLRSCGAGLGLGVSCFCFGVRDHDGKVEGGAPWAGSPRSGDQSGALRIWGAKGEHTLKGPHRPHGRVKKCCVAGTDAPRLRLREHGEPCSLAQEYRVSDSIEFVVTS